MTRQEFLTHLLGLASIPIAACALPTDPGSDKRNGIASDGFDVRKTEVQWRALLPPGAYEVLFEEGTEMPGSSPLTDEHRAGSFLCAACLIALFDSGTKYESGTGWPSFWDPIPGRLEFKQDLTAGLERTEYHCTRCGGHQGHVFDDGPPPTGKRYCNNGIALQFVAQGEPIPSMRS